METSLATRRFGSHRSQGVLDAIAYDDPTVRMSPLSQVVADDGTMIAVRIYRFPRIRARWVLEIVDENGGLTLWSAVFPNDRAALRRALDVIEAEGIRTFLGRSETLH